MATELVSRCSAGHFATEGTFQMGKSFGKSLNGNNKLPE